VLSGKDGHLIVVSFVGEKGVCYLVYSVDAYFNVMLDGLFI